MSWFYLPVTWAISFKRAIMAGPSERASAGVRRADAARDCRRAWSALDILDPRFILLNGDSLFDINIRALVAEDDASCEAVIALRTVPEASRYGTIELNGDRVVRFREKVNNSGPALINAGIYVLSAAI